MLTGPAPKGPVLRPQLPQHVDKLVGELVSRGDRVLPRGPTPTGQNESTKLLVSW